MKFSKKFNEAKLKELNQLQQWEALLPKKRRFVTAREGKSDMVLNVPERKTWRHYQSKRMWRWQIAEVIYDKIELNVSILHHLCQRQIRGGNWHKRCIPTPNMEQDVHMLVEGMIAKLIVKLEPKLNSKYIWKKHDNSCYMSNSRRHYLGLCTRHCYFGNCY